MRSRANVCLCGSADVTLIECVHAQKQVVSASLMVVCLCVRMQNATVDDAVGSVLVATQTGLDVAVTFYIITGNTTVFKIGLCNGQLRINQALLNYQQQPSYTLLVQARSNALASSATNATITVNVLNVPHAPVFNSSTCVVSGASFFSSLLVRGGDSTEHTNAECVHAPKGLVLPAHESLRRDRPGGFTSPAFHACGQSFSRTLLSEHLCSKTK